MAFRSTLVRYSTSAMKKWAYYASGFNKYGLLRDDCLYESADVVEALRRIPKNLVDERNYRILRAIQLSIMKRVLPKEEWTKLEEDVLYLSPMVESVRRERLEREEWIKQY